MEWKNRTLRSVLKGNKEKVIFLFCSGMLLFVISLPSGKATDPEWKGKTAEVLADVSVNGEDTAVEDAGAKAENSSYEKLLEQRIRGGGCDGGAESFGGEDLACG